MDKSIVDISIPIITHGFNRGKERCCILGKKKAPNTNSKHQKTNFLTFF